MKSPLFLRNIQLRFIVFIFCFVISAPSFSQARVIGGTDADIKDFPWQVAVDYGCGGTIIGDSWVLTAAHCVVGGANIIYAGNSAPYASGGETYSVANVITHPLYGSGTSYSHDFALVEIEGEFNFTNPNIGKIDLITAADVSAGSEDPGVIATITGWGTIDDGSMATSLQMTQAPIVGNDVACGSTTDANGNSGDYSCSSLDGSMICAGDLVDGGEDACQGDSGGPLIVRSLIDNRWVLIGATSWGYGCADVNYPGVWARVSYVSDWIEDSADINSEYGCMDTSACNFSAEAIYDVSESCVFEVDECGECGGSGPPSGYDCDGNCLSGETLNISMSDSYGDGWNGSNLVVNGQSVTLITGSSGAEILCFDSIQGCNEVTVSAGSYAPEVSWTISDADGNVLISGGAPYSGGFGAENCGPPILGCTDSSALNYNSEASQDDGTCQFPITCSDSLTSVLIEVTEGSWPSEVSWEINDSISGAVGETLVCLQDGCYNFKMIDSYGDGWNGSEVTVSDSSGVLLNGTLSSGSEGILAFSLNYEGSCFPAILGCTDTSAVNYNVDATLDDGSCQAPIDCSGLTSVYIQVTDGSYPSEISWEVGGFSGGVGAHSVCLQDGCFSLILQDSYGDGWNGAFISVSDFSGSLINNETLNTGSEGVLVFSLNYEGECLPTISGCTDSSALNYNADATLDDGACQYPIDCDSLTTVSIDVGGGSWQSEVSWEIGGYTGGVGLTEACLNDGCLVFNMYDSYGDGWNGNDVTISDSSGVLLTGTLNLGSEGQLNFGFNYEGDCGETLDTLGCTNPLAVNYDSLATLDDGSCEADECICPELFDPVCGSDGVTYSNDCEAACEGVSYLLGACSDSIYGCTDSSACNYNPLAEQDNQTCYNNDFGCGCDQPAAVSGFDCDGNVIILSCEETHQESYAYGNNEDTPFNYTLPDNQVAVIYITGETETRPSGGCYDYIYVFNGADSLIETLCGDFDQMIVSNDNGISIVFDTDGSVSPQDNYSYSDGPTSWTVECGILGCTNVYADNYDSLATIDAGSCVLSVIPGCTDTLACNFVDTADVDDNSCTYAEAGFDCNGSCIDDGTSSVIVEQNSPFYGDGAYYAEYSLTNSNGDIVAEGPQDTGDWYESDDTLNCIPDGCYEFAVTSPYGSSYANPTYYNWIVAGQTFVTGQSGQVGFGELGCVTGCMDPLAENYNPNAFINDLDSCTYDFVWGCTDTLACNYADSADVDDSSCTYAAEGFDCDGSCTDNGTSSVIVEQNSPNWGDGTYGATYTLSQDGVVVFEGPQDTGNWYESDDTWDCIPDGCYNFSVSTHIYGGSYSTSYYSWIIGGETFGMATSGLVSLGETAGCVTGCMDPSAENYNPDADISSLDSCTYDFVLGCMDTLACNYDVLADTSNVNSCSYPELGQDCDGNLVPLVCGDASNVGSYEYVNSDYTTFEYVFPEGEIATLTIAGETETAYSGGCYDYVYVFDGAGSLIQSLCGVFDQTIVSNDNGISFTFDSDGSASASTGSVDGSSWSLDCAVQGCTDPGADNYNPLAQFDNGSCVTSCPDGTGSVAVIVIADTYVSQETSYSLTGDNGFSFFYDFTNDDNMDVITNEFCIPNGTNMSFVITDTNGDGLVPPSGYEIQVCDQSLTGQLQFISSNSETHEFQVMCGDVYGCDDASALNYDSDATINDGSCDYPCLGLEAVVTHTASSQFAFEQSWYIMNTSTSQTVASGPNVPEGELWNGPQEVQEVCLTEGADYMLYMLDSDGDGWNNGGTGGSISIESPCGMLVENAEGTASVSSETFTACVVNPCPAPDSWATTVTGSNHTIVIPSGSIVSLSDGSTLDHANVGVFFTDSLGNLVCAGSTQVSPGETAAIAAMGDDTTTPEVDGLVAGEEFMWMIADCNGNVFAASATYSPISVNSFLVNGVSYVTAITEVSEGPSSQVIDLPNGWSMFSTYMIADDMDMASVLAPIIDDVVIAKNNSGSAYLVEWNFNGVGSLLVGQGYQIKTEAEVSLEISGAYATPEDHSVALSAGWNMIGYLRTESAAADAVLADINSTGNLIIAKDYNGQAYLPEWNFNGIGDMNPGEGYQLKTNNADVLQFLSNDESYRMSTVEVIENNVSHFAKVVPTDNNMTVVIDDAVWDVLPSEGAEIAAFDKDGNQVGSAIYSSPVTVIAIWGDDATSSSKDGMEVSEPVSFKVWNTNDVRDFTVSKWIEGSSSYQVDAINIASSIETNTIMTELNTPVRVLVKVINVLGQEVNMDDEPFKGTVLFKVYDDGSVERYVR